MSDMERVWSGLREIGVATDADIEDLRRKAAVAASARFPWGYGLSIGGITLVLAACCLLPLLFWSAPSQDDAREAWRQRSEVVRICSSETVYRFDGRLYAGWRGRPIALDVTLDQVCA